MVGGFGDAGVPAGLIAAVLERAPRDLTVIANNAGFHPGDISDWLSAGLVRKVICSYPRTSPTFVALYRAGKVALELLPQGTLVERMRCAGAGLGGFFSPVSAGTLLGAGRETRTIAGRDYVLETAALRRLRPHPRTAGRPDGQPHLQQDRAQLRPGDGECRPHRRGRGEHDRGGRGDRPGGRGHAGNPRRSHRAGGPPCP